MGKLENKFQADLIKELKKKYPDSIIVKNDALYIQGIPDLTIFEGKQWATLECKKDNKSTHRPNQDYYVDKMNGMSFSRFVSPENKEEVLNELEVFFHRPQ